MDFTTRRSHVVRGHGPFDLFLAKQRYKIAKKQVKAYQKNGRILDIGCGSYPLFLTTVDFAEKYGLDKTISADPDNRTETQGITLIGGKIERQKRLPFENDYFDVISMLGVFEHIEATSLIKIHREVHRILKPGGMYVMTTPAFWTEMLLTLLAKLRLISAVEISDHKDCYNHAMISSILQEAHFQKDKLQFGYFELFMNTWATAIK